MNQSEEQSNHQIEEKSKPGPKGLTRRDFIKKSVGAAVLLAAASSPVVPVLNRARASASSPSKTTELVGGQTEEKALAGEKDRIGAAQSVHGTEPETKVRAWCMVIDLKKCEGCATIDSPPQCTQACIAGHFVPKGQQWIQVYEVELPGGGAYFMPTPCFQCESAPCVNVCPVAATYHNKDGVVLIDHLRCIGCRMCMAACPYHRRFFNWGTPKLPPEAALVKYSPVYPVPAVKGTVIKCMFCAHMLRDGKLPLCVTGCPMKALYIGDLNEDIASNGVELVQLANFLAENDAYRYKEELGTQPRVWYLPGHGQNFGRKAKDSRLLKPATWPWGGDGYDRRPGIWPWGKE